MLQNLLPFWSQARSGLLQHLTSGSYPLFLMLLLLGLSANMVQAQPWYYQVNECDPSTCPNPDVLDIEEVVEVVPAEDDRVMTLSTVTYPFGPSCQRKVCKLSKIDRLSGEEIWTRFFEANTLGCQDHLEGVGLTVIPAAVNTGGKETYVIAANRIPNAGGTSKGVVLKVGYNGFLGVVKELAGGTTLVHDVMYRPLDADPSTDDEDLVVLFEMATSGGFNGFGINVLDPNSFASNHRESYGFSDHTVVPTRFVESATTREIFIIGHSLTTIASVEYPSDLVVSKIENDGTLAWIKEHETPGWIETPKDIALSTDPATKSVAIVGATFEYTGGSTIGDENGLFVEFDTDGIPMVYNKYNVLTTTWPTDFRSIEVNPTMQQYVVVGTGYETDKTMGRVGTSYLTINNNGSHAQELLQEFYVTGATGFVDVTYDEDFDRMAVLGVNQNNMTLFEPYNNCQEWNIGCHDITTFYKSTYTDDGPYDGNSYSYSPSTTTTFMYDKIVGDIAISQRGCLNPVGNPAALYSISGTYPMAVNPPPPPLVFNVEEVVDVVNTADNHLLVLGTANLSYGLLQGGSYNNKVVFLSKIDHQTNLPIWTTTLEQIDYFGTLPGSDISSVDLTVIPGSPEAYVVATVGATGLGSAISHIDFSGNFVKDYTIPGLSAIKTVQYSSNSGQLNVLGETALGGFDQAFTLSQIDVSGAVWTMTNKNIYGNYGEDVFPALLHENAGGDLFIAGYKTERISGDPTDLVLAKLSSTNSLVWMKSFPVQNGNVRPRAMVNGLAANTQVLTGDFEETNGDMKTFFLSFDEANGAAIDFTSIDVLVNNTTPWNRTFDLVSNECPDHYTLVGRMNANPSFAGASNSILLVQVNRQGKPLESKVDWFNLDDYKYGAIMNKANTDYNVAAGNFLGTFVVNNTEPSGAGYQSVHCGVNDGVSYTTESLDDGHTYQAFTDATGLNVANIEYQSRTATLEDESCPAYTFIASNKKVSVPEPAATGLEVYPNPFEDQIRIEAEGSIEQVRVLNVSGQVVLTSNASIINTEDLPSGLYLVEVRTTEGATNTLKMTKN